MESLYNSLRIKWDMQGNYFYPLSQTSSKNLLVFDWREFSDVDDNGLSVNHDKIINILKKFGISTVICNSIYDGIYETSVSELWLGVGEVYWFDKSLNWVIYVSHEGTITFAGDMLVQNINKEFGDKFLATDWV